jgi:hypothetical protein
MNLHILYSYESFIDNKYPKVERLEKINHSSDPGIQEINEILRSMTKNDYEKIPHIGKKDLDNGYRIVVYGWDLIYRKINGLFIMVVDLNHMNMSQFNRNAKIDLINEISI